MTSSGPVLMSTCPDCGAVYDEEERPPTVGVLHHVDTCPAGLALDRVNAADCEWFDNHPGAQRYHRPITPAEVADMKTVGVSPTDAFDFRGKVRVELLAPRGVCRWYDNVRCLCPSIGDAGREPIMQRVAEHPCPSDDPVVEYACACERSSSLLCCPHCDGTLYLMAAPGTLCEHARDFVREVRAMLSPDPFAWIPSDRCIVCAAPAVHYDRAGMPRCAQHSPAEPAGGRDGG